MKLLSKIIEGQSLDKGLLAEKLFENDKHPKLTINRVLEGHRELTAAEYRKLAEITDVPLAFLMAADWIGQSDKTGALRFLKGEVVCELAAELSLARIYKITPQGLQEYISFTPENVPVSVLLSDLTALIINKNNINLKSIKK